MRMVKYMNNATIDDFTNLPINESTIGITNRKGFNILQNRNLTTKRIGHLLLKNKCNISVVSKSFPALSLALSVMKDQFLKNRFKNAPYCPYCKHSEDLGLQSF
jgi:hypothetical protein